MKKIITSIIISALLLQLFGCFSMREITIEELNSAEDKPEIEAITQEGHIYNFEEDNYYFSVDSIAGKGLMKTNRILKDQYQEFKYQSVKPFEGKIALNDIQIIETNKFNVPLSIFAAAATVTVLYFALKDFKPLGDNFLGGSKLKIR